MSFLAYHEEVELRILCSLLSNPERYKYITSLYNNGSISQEEATLKNINKAKKIASEFMKRARENV